LDCSGLKIRRKYTVKQIKSKNYQRKKRPKKNNMYQEMKNAIAVVKQDLKPLGGAVGHRRRGDRKAMSGIRSIRIANWINANWR